MSESHACSQYLRGVSSFSRRSTPSRRGRKCTQLGSCIHIANKYKNNNAAEPAAKVLKQQQSHSTANGSSENVPEEASANHDKPSKNAKEASMSSHSSHESDPALSDVEKCLDPKLVTMRQSIERSFDLKMVSLQAFLLQELELKKANRSQIIEDKAKIIEEKAKIIEDKVNLLQEKMDSQAAALSRMEVSLGSLLQLAKSIQSSLEEVHPGYAFVCNQPTFVDSDARRQRSHLSNKSRMRPHNSSWLTSKRQDKK